jgi:hypothetical protein
MGNAGFWEGGKLGCAVERWKALDVRLAKHLPAVVKLYLSREAGRIPGDNWVVSAIRPLARKIELLNPDIKDGGRSPQNREYPWIAADGSVKPPADHPCQFNILFEKAGVSLMKILRQAAVDLQQ